MANNTNNFLCDTSHQTNQMNQINHNQTRPQPDSRHNQHNQHNQRLNSVNSVNSQWLSMASLQTSQSSQASAQHVSKWNTSNNSSPELLANSKTNKCPLLNYSNSNSHTNSHTNSHSNSNSNTSKKANVSVVNSNELLDRLMQLQDCIKQVKSVISNLEKSDDSGNREQLARLVAILRGMQREERQHLHALQTNLGDDYFNSSNIYNVSANYNNGVNAIAGDDEHCGDSLSQETIARSSVTHLMNKLQESQQKLSALQSEQSRLLQLQKKAENKLEQMTLMKKELESQRSLDANCVNVNTNAFAGNSIVNDSLDANSVCSENGSMPCLKDLSSRIRSLQGTINGRRHNNIDVDIDDNCSDDMNNVNDETEDDIDDLLLSKLKNLQIKKSRINDIMRENSSAQHNCIDKRSLTQRFQLAQNLQNKLQRRYEADGSEEDEMRVNQLMLPYAHQRSLSNDDVNNIDAINMPSTLANKLRELQEAEARLKQVEDLMKSIEEMETNIKEAEGESNNDNRKSLNENQSKFSRDTNRSRINSITSNTTSVKQPKQLIHSSNLSNLASNQQKNIMPRYIEENTGAGIGAQSTQRVEMIANTEPDESDANEQSFNLVNCNLIRSMRSQFESMLLVLENQCSNSNYVNSQQLMHLMLMQNYQMMQQQQIMLLWLQQQHQQHALPQQYFDVRQTNIASTPISLPQSSLQRSSQSAPTALNNQVVPGVRANNYWDNFRSYSRQNKLSASTVATNTNNNLTVKGNENLTITNNQMGCPLVATEHTHNSNQDLNSLSPNGGNSGRHTFKTANASHVQCVEHIEKQQNLPLNDGNQCKQSTHQLDSNNFAAIFSMLEKLIENDDKCAQKCATKKKSTNLIITDNDEDCGAVGGVGISNAITNQSTQEENNESKCSAVLQQSLSARSQLSGNVSVPLHIPASSGAIRKKPRNQEILELTSKTENSDLISHSLAIGSEMIRPLMPAEGRSSEIAISNLIPTQSSQKGHHLSVRPPTTGAPGYSECDGGDDDSSDDLAEADQTTAEVIASESETLHDNVILSPPTNSVSVLIAECQRAVSEDHLVVVSNGDEEDDDPILANNSNDTGIRLSGDGEQGL